MLTSCYSCLDLICVTGSCPNGVGWILSKKSYPQISDVNYIKEKKVFHTILTPLYIKEKVKKDKKGWTTVIKSRKISKVEFG